MPARQIRSLRSATGCKTCRRRHVKCDEGKPTCRNCGIKSRNCVYEETANKQQDRGDNADSRSGDAVDAFPPSQTDRRPVALTTHPRDEFPAVEQPLHSASTPISPFSATLESILLQANRGLNPVPSAPSQTNQVVSLFVDPYARLQECSQLSPTVAQRGDLLLNDIERAIFRNYVEVVSKWVDSFSHDQPFHRVIPVLALRCQFLLHACLALSSKQMILMKIPIHESTAFRFYRLALEAIGDLLVHPLYAQSDELLAACTILSTYEMIDVVGESLGSHLKGVASLLQTRSICGNDLGIRGACYWTWYRHEIWASLQTGRGLSLDEKYWRPASLDSFDDLTVESISNRVIFIWGQCINFCNDHQEHMATGVDHDARARELGEALDSWKAKLPPSMACFEMNDASDSGAYSPLWFLYPESAVAHQVYHACKILLALHRPSLISGSTGRDLWNLQSLSLRRHIEASRERIFLTAIAGIPDAWSLVSVQCLYIAGLVTDGVEERRETLRLINECQKTSGRRTCSIVDQLQQMWSYNQFSPP